MQIKVPVPQDGLRETAERLRIAWAKRCPRLAQVAQSSPWPLKSDWNGMLAMSRGSDLLGVELPVGLLVVPSTSLDDLCRNPTNAQTVIHWFMIRRSLARSLPGLCVLQQDMVPGASCCRFW